MVLKVNTLVADKLNGAVAVISVVGPPPDFKYNFPALALPAVPIPIVLSSAATDNV